MYHGTALRLLVALLVALTVGGCLLVEGLFGIGGEFRQAEAFARRGLQYNIDAVARKRDSKVLHQHIVALGRFGSRRAVLPALALAERLIYDADERPELVFPSINGLISDLTGLDAVPGRPQYVSRQGRKEMVDYWRRQLQPGTLVEARANVPALRFVNLQNFALRFTLPLAPERPLMSKREASDMWHDWWASDTDVPWMAHYAWRVWRESEPELLPYAYWELAGSHVKFHLDRNAQLCGIPLEQWRQLVPRERARLLMQALKRIDISVEEWRSLVRQERDRTDAEEAVGHVLRLELFIAQGREAGM